jgi:PhnB protein
MTELYRFLAVRDTEAATEFYAAAFGATVVQRFGPVRVLEIEGFHVGLAPEAPELGTPSPETVGATTVRISLHVDDPDAVAAQAVAAGATLLFPVDDQDYGMRQGRVARSSRCPTRPPRPLRGSGRRSSPRAPRRGRSRASGSSAGRRRCSR